MTQPPYGDEGYGPVPDSNDPGVPSENEGRPGARNPCGRGNPGDESGDLAQGWSLEGSGTSVGQGQSSRQDQWGGYDQTGHAGGHANGGQPGAYGQSSHPGGVAGQSASGKSPRMLLIIGGAVLLVLIVLVALVFFVFGDSEKRDRKAVVEASNEVIETMQTGDKFSDLNDLVCPGYQADEEAAKEIDERMAAIGIYLDDVFDEPGMSDGVQVADDVAFTSDKRREATVTIIFENVEDEMVFRKVGRVWMFCQGDLSDLGTHSFNW